MRTNAPLLLLAMSALACAPRPIRPVEILPSAQADADLLATAFAPSRHILSGFDQADAHTPWQPGDRILLGLQIVHGYKHTVRFVLLELKSRTLPSDADVVILPPDTPPPADAEAVSLDSRRPAGLTHPQPAPDAVRSVSDLRRTTHALSEPAASLTKANPRDGAVDQAGLADGAHTAAPRSLPDSPPGSPPKTIYLILSDDDDPDLAGRLPARRWSMTAVLVDQAGNTRQVTSESDPVFVAVYVFDEAGRKIKASGTLAPEAYLRRGFFAACQVATRHATQRPNATLAIDPALADVFPSLYGIGQVLGETRSLRNIIKAIVPRPSIWSLLTHGGRIDVTVQAELRKAEPDARILPTQGYGMPALRFPIDLNINDEPAISCVLSVTEPAPPFHLSAGVVAVDGVQVNDPTKRFSVRVLAARRADSQSPASTEPNSR